MRALILLSALVAIVPLVPPTDATCVPTCGVPAATPGFALPIIVLDSGDTVTWSSLDQAHTATESAAGPCFSVGFGPTSPGSASFRVSGGQLFAQQPARAEKACLGAQALPDGSFVIQYHCAFHSQMMGTLVVRPGA